jgi:hypothetical protein
MKAQKGSRCVALLFLQPQHKKGAVDNVFYYSHGRMGRCNSGTIQNLSLYSTGGLFLHFHLKIQD